MKLIQKLFRHFPTPRYMAMPHVGIDISTNSIRYLELVRKPYSMVLGRYGIQQIPTPVSFNEPLVAHTDLVSALKKIQRTNKFNFVEVSIPEDKSYLFTMEIPTGDPEAIRSHIEFHLEENVPIRLSEAVFDYYIIHKNNKRGVDLASVSVVPMQVIDQYIEVFEAAGMTPVSFLIENQALTKAIIAEEDQSMYLVVHIGDKKTVLSIVSEGAVQFTSTVPVGGDDFTNAIAKEYKISFAEAEKMKKEKGFTRTSENTTFFMLLINAVSALRDEIQKAYMYWLSHVDKSGKDASIPLKVILAGRDSSIIGFRDYMSLSLKVPVDLANVWVNVLSFNDEIPPIEYLESLDYATVVGLALPKNTR